MFLRKSFFEFFSICSCCGCLVCILLQYFTNISLITGIWFTIYTVSLFILSVLLAFDNVQKLLKSNQPMKVDLVKLKSHPYFNFIADVFPQPSKRPVIQCLEYDTNELSVISSVLERQLVSSWYTQYVSPEIGFPFACKQMLDQMIGKTFQICNNISTKDVYVDVCFILMTHLKEYKKALRRWEKSPNESIETLYKKTHKMFAADKKTESADHCTNLLRIILKELVPWELWDTPHSELLVRVLSNKLDNFIDNSLADPVWLNDKLMAILTGEKCQPIKTEEPNEIFMKKEELSPHISPEEEISEVPKEVEIPSTETPPKPETTIESALSTLVANTTAPILSNALNEDYEPSEVIDPVDTTAQEAFNGTEPVDINASPVLRQRRGRQGRSEVKIYDRIIEGSVKTWETDTDLQCISLGQDLLASLNGEITLSRLWGQDPQDYDGKQESRFWFGEENALEMEADSKEVSPVKKELSPKPADVLLKELQTTVHQAKSKIGDLQVPLVIDVTNNDEAAGMMEGLLDFGIAGLKKGLRFTGLSDDAQEKSPSHRERDKDKSEKSPPPDSKHKSAEILDSTQDLKDTGNSSVIQREENGNTTAPPLVKQQRVSSQDSVVTGSLPKPILSSKGEFPPLVPVSDSPEPEYEEAADLSTSIAKLRCLLQQRAEAGNSSQSSKADDIWWEGAEETRGRTQQHLSSRPVDTAIFADEYDMNAAEKNSPNQTSNNMQRLDKLFQRTVTGVFNSIKTAVGAEGEAEGAARALHDWTYVCTPVELSVGGAMARLVGSRRAYNHVETALDSLEQLSTKPQQKEIVPEDLDEWCVSLGPAWTAGAELAAAAGLCRTGVAFRVATLLAGDIAESLINGFLNELSSWLREQVFSAFKQMAEDSASRERAPLVPFNIDETCATIMKEFPSAAYVFGEDNFDEALHLSVSSLTHKEINKDIIFRWLDLYVMHFKIAAGTSDRSLDDN